MDILHSDRVVVILPGRTPNYNSDNPLVALIGEMERVQLACDREWYLRNSLEYLFPFESLEMYGPQGADASITDPTRQDSKTDFQKQNVKSFVLSATHLVRGWVTLGDWTGAFLRLSYQAGPDSPLWKAHGGVLGPDIRLHLRVGSNATSTPLTVPYNPNVDRYEIELWGYTGARDLRTILRGPALAALDRGELQVRNDLVRGDPASFLRESVMNQDVRSVASDCTMHPLLPLHIECAWADRTLTHWDSNDGRNHHHEFNMIVRGWDNFLSVGTSGNPHGGVGFLEYRNLLSNYGAFAGSGELARQLAPWGFDAFGSKDHGNRVEPFLAADYFDLHLLRPDCGIGLHRHRDNQEIFFMLNGRGYMIVGDWCKMPQRERCFEIRTLRSGHLAMLKGGNLHALVNATDENISLFMFGGYD